MTRIKLTTFQEVPTVDKEVQRVLLWQLDALPDDVVKVISGKVIWHEVPKRKRQSDAKTQKQIPTEFLVRLVTHLVLSMSGSFEVSDFSQMTGMRSG